MQYLCNQLRGVCGAALTPTYFSGLYCVQSFRALTLASECLFYFILFFIHGGCIQIKKEKTSQTFFLQFKINITLQLNCTECVLTGFVSLC